jgi:hypothetical protein
MEWSTLSIGETILSFRVPWRHLDVAIANDDSGRVKENTFDPETSITRLEETWTSRASSKQRRGRAGRTRPGRLNSYHTFL